MTVKRVLYFLFSVLGILLLVAEVSIYRTSSADVRAADYATASNRTIDALLDAAAGWALERGTVNSALNSAVIADVAVLQKISLIRAKADEHYAEAEKLVVNYGLNTDLEIAAGVDKVRVQLKEIRAEADKQLALAKPNRRAGIAQDWFKTISRMIMETQKLRLKVSSQSLDVKQGAVSKNALISHAVWLMREYAGRERGKIAGILASGAAMTAEDKWNLAIFRGKVDEGWSIFSNVQFTPEEQKEFEESRKNAAAIFFGEFETLRAKVYGEANQAAGYTVSVDEWMQQSTRAIDSLAKIQEQQSKWMLQTLNDNKQKAVSQMLQSKITLLVAAGFMLLALFVVSLRIVRPMTVLSGSLRQMAQGYLDMTIPYGDRTDEIGTMARSVEGIRECIQQRTNSLASRLKGSVMEVVNNVSVASQELQHQAQSLNGLAEQGSTGVDASSNGAQQALGNVEIVAGATVQLNASINEIETRVKRACTIVEQAVEKGARANNTVSNLAQFSRNTEEIIALINSIAEQTSLLALNATIESARAGDAGKGFAVVASEVKGLSQQTSEAIDEIRSQIDSMQSDVAVVVDEIVSIGTVLEEINAISASISSSVEQQALAVNEIAKNASLANNSVSQIVGGVSSLAGVSMQIKKASSTMLDAATKLGDESSNLNCEVDRFLASVTMH